RASNVVEPFEPWRDRVEVALMGRDRRQGDVRPHDGIRSRNGGQCPGPIAESPDGGRELAKTARPGGDRGRLGGQGGAELVYRSARLRRKRLTQEGERGIDAPVDLDSDDRTANALAGGDGEDAQVAGKIAAVDGRHVAGLQGPERAGVVPVVEMPAVAFEVRDRRQGGLEPIDRV